MNNQEMMPENSDAQRKSILRILNASVFLQTQMFLLPVLLLFYQHNGLSVGDFFLFQGIFSLMGLLLELPAGYLGDLFPKKYVLMMSYSFFILRLLLWIFFAHYGYWILLMGEVLYAAQKASFSGASDGYVYEYLKSRNISEKMLKHYGKLNFFMSIGTALSSLSGAWLYQTVSEWSVAKYHQDYGFCVLLAMELILNLSAFYLLILLPSVQKPAHKHESLREVYSNFFNIIKWTAQSQKIRYHIIYSGLLSSITLVFVWSFQPIMKLLAFPVSVFGVVYFINHLFRALSSFYLEKIRKIFTFAKLSLLVFVLFIFCFIMTFVILNIQPLPIYVNMLYFVFVTFTIGLQLSLSLSNTSRIHEIVPQEMRATIASIGIASGRMFAGFFFVLLKILLDGLSTQASLWICFGFYIVFAIPLKWVYSISSKEQ